jgi:DNA-binding MarR family transcriptional regulator
MVRKLVADGLVAEEKVPNGADAREKPLVLTDRGVNYLKATKQREAIRFKYLFDGVSPEEWKGLVGLLDKLDKAAKRQVDEMIFGK